MASLIGVGGISAVDFGPSTTDTSGRPFMHAIDEHVTLDDLVATAHALALAAVRYGD